MRVVCLDVAMRHNGLVHARVFPSTSPRAQAHALLKGVLVHIFDYGILDVIAEGGGAELGVLEKTSEDIDANGISVEDAVVLHIRATIPRLEFYTHTAVWTSSASALPPPSPSPPLDALAAIYIEAQPMGGSKPGGAVAAASAQLTRNVRTKCLQHALQGALLVRDATRDTRVRFVSPQIKAQDFDALGRGKPKDYAARKAFGIVIARRLLAATIEVDCGVDFCASMVDEGAAELEPLLPRDHPNTRLLCALLKRKRCKGVHKQKMDDVCDALLEAYYAARGDLADSTKMNCKVAKAEAKAQKVLDVARLKGERAAKTKLAGKKRSRSCLLEPALFFEQKHEQEHEVLAKSAELASTHGVGDTLRLAKSAKELAKRFPCKAKVKAQAMKQTKLKCTSYMAPEFLKLLE